MFEKASVILGVNCCNCIFHHRLWSPATSEPRVQAPCAFPCCGKGRDTLHFQGSVSASGLYPVPHYSLAVVILCNWVSGKCFSFIFPWFLWKPIPQPLPSECRNHSRVHKWEICPFSVLAKCLLHLHYGSFKIHSQNATCFGRSCLFQWGCLYFIGLHFSRNNLLHLPVFACETNLCT